jgi:hypothetical protein
MKTTLKLAFIPLFLGLATAAEWPPVIPWTIETRDPAAQNLRILRNETVQLRPQFLNGAAAVSIPTNATVTFRYRDASISTGAYHVATGTVYNATNGQVNLLWVPAYCGTLTNYAYNILVSSNTVVCYRGFGGLRFQGVVEGTVTTNPAGRITIDWSQVDNSNLDSAPFAQSVSGISSAQCVSIVGNILPTATVSHATTADTATDPPARSNAATAQARADLSVTNAGATVNGQAISNGAAIVIDTGVSTATATSIAQNVVAPYTNGAALGATALQPTGNGSGLTGITPGQIGAVSPSTATQIVGSVMSTGTAALAQGLYKQINPSFAISMNGEMHASSGASWNIGYGGFGRGLFGLYTISEANFWSAPTHAVNIQMLTQHVASATASSVTNAGATVNGQSISNGAAIVIDTGVSTATATSIAESVVGSVLPTSSVAHATTADTAIDATARSNAATAQATADLAGPYLASVIRLDATNPVIVVNAVSNYFRWAPTNAGACNVTITPLGTNIATVGVLHGWMQHTNTIAWATNILFNVTGTHTNAAPSLPQDWRFTIELSEGQVCLHLAPTNNIARP